MSSCQSKNGDAIQKAPGMDLEKTPSLAASALKEGETKILGDEAVHEFYAGAVSDTYRLKSELVARHIAELGMGKFQCMLFVVSGFGWLVDNFWSQGITAIRPAVANEFTDISYLSFSSVAYYVGLILGASFWGTSADLIGRKPAFNATLFIGGIFGRYLMITLGGIALAFGLIRVFCFKIPESPAYLLSKGRDADAVEAVNYICRYNGRPETLTLEMLQYIDQQQQVGHLAVQPAENINAPAATIAERSPRLMSYIEILRESFRDYNTNSYRKLFAGRKMAQHSSVTFLIWLTVGIAYPLYFAFITSYLETKSSYSATSSSNYTYMVYCIVSVVGVLGPIAAGFAVETRFGRRWMMAASAILTGVFLFAYTTVETGAADIGFQCATAILGNFEYAIMYAFTPESFPGPVRGTGTGMASTLLRIGGLVASLISTYGGYTTVPIYASAGLWIVVGIFCLALPYETRGHASI
ncbi:putative hexose transporter protein [Eutypa lata UCREL1]|uniref:Putative hexose transporter protein n=1 Tax=Eutypa lata (strain UCR-EL1) TaxID=1287681 RepID=M7SJ88_EUTLA|nr:putative hexose transporter protein [Eutypa lata UCREL1]